MFAVPKIECKINFLKFIHLLIICLQPKFKDSSAYIFKYKQCLGKAVLMMKNYTTQILVNATEQALSTQQAKEADALKIIDKNSDTAFALFYGKFQASAPKVKKISSLIEERIDQSQEYDLLLSELQQTYLSQRALVMSPGVDSAIKNLTGNHKGDHCALVRSACAFLVHVCQDEHRLFYQFFSNQSLQLT